MQNFIADELFPHEQYLRLIIFFLYEWMTLQYYFIFMNDVSLPAHYSHGCVEIICIVGIFPKSFARY